MPMRSFPGALSNANAALDASSSAISSRRFTPISLSLSPVVKRVLLFVLLALLGWIAWEVITFPDVSALANEPPKTTAFMEQRKEQLRADGKSDALEWQWVSYGRISPNLRRA